MALPSFLLLNGTTAVDGLITRAKRTSTKEVKGEVSPKVRQVFHLNGTGGKANLNQDKLSFSQELVNRIGATVSIRAKLDKEGNVIKDGNLGPATKFMPRFLTRGQVVTYTSFDTGLSEEVTVDVDCMAVLACGAFGNTALPTYSIAGEKLTMDLTRQVQHESGSYSYSEVLAEVLGIDRVPQEFFLRDENGTLVRDEEGKSITDIREVWNNFDFDLDTTGFYSFHDAKTEIRAYAITVGEQYAPPADKERESFARKPKTELVESGE